MAHFNAIILYQPLEYTAHFLYDFIRTFVSLPWHTFDRDVASAVLFATCYPTFIFFRFLTKVITFPLQELILFLELYTTADGRLEHALYPLKLFVHELHACLHFTHVFPLFPFQTCVKFLHLSFSILFKLLQQLGEVFSHGKILKSSKVLVDFVRENK